MRQQQQQQQPGAELDFRKRGAQLLNLALALSQWVRDVLTRPPTVGWRWCPPVQAGIGYGLVFLAAALSGSEALWALFGLALLCHLAHRARPTPDPGVSSRYWGESRLMRPGGSEVAARRAEGALVGACGGLVLLAGWDRPLGLFLVASGVAAALVVNFAVLRTRHEDADIRDGRADAVSRSRRLGGGGG